jgi:serine/threonine protein kinase
MKQEIGILSGMEHPNIVNYTESYEDARYLYIVMEYV